MLDHCIRHAQPHEAAIPVKCIQLEHWDDVSNGLSASARTQVELAAFTPIAGAIQVVYAPSGQVEQLLFGVSAGNFSNFSCAKLLSALPRGVYQLQGYPHDINQALLGIALANYQFNRYKTQGKPNSANVTFIAPQNVDLKSIHAMAEAVYLGRDLINIPANDLGTQELADAAIALASQYNAQVTVTSGEALAQGFPLVYAVGKASVNPPLVIDLRWQPQAMQAGAPKITIVGKGVVFDTGGLDIKPASAMLLMKKDMGGAATALALASMIMSHGLHIDLRVLIPTAENSIAGNAFRPNDIYPSRKGMTVEIGDTDAEGRLLLADALTYADEARPDMILNFATLTGAARVAMGPELVPFFSTDDAFAQALSAASTPVEDPVWRLPFWQGYDSWLKSSNADISSTGSKSGAGCITAALFLKRFVEHTPSFSHFDVFAWNPSTSPARPEGREILAARAVFEVLKTRYAKA